MPANINSGFFAVPAWHGEGYVNPEGKPLPLDEAFQLGGLDYTVSKRPIFHGDGSMSNLDKRIITRDDTGRDLGVVGSDYEIMQNADLRDLLAEICHNSPDIETHALGALGDGERIWLLVKVPGQMVISAQRDDTVDQYITLASSHDGSLGINLFWTPIRVVCQNTLSAALRGFKSKRRKGADLTVNPMGIVLKHTKNVSTRVVQARKALALSDIWFQEMSEIFKALDNFDISTVQFDGFLDHVFPIADDAKRTHRAEYARGEVVRLFESGKGNRGQTAWDAYNGLTEFCDYDTANFRNTAGKNASEEAAQASVSANRFESVLFGGGTMATKKREGFEYLATEVAGLDLSKATMPV